MSVLHRRPRLQFLEQRLAPATFTVNALGDANVGTANSGDIRYCLGKAANGDIVNFDATLFSTPQTINVSTQLVVGGNITINGPGSAFATLKNVAAAGATSRVVQVGPGWTVAISGLTITGGNLTTTNNGAGIESQAASLSLADCLITGNTTAEDGAGIAVTEDFGLLTLTDCTVSGNHATGSFSDGGGIYMAPESVLTLKNSTISSNDSAHNGGGVYFFLFGSYTVENSTISGNSTAGKGGAIYFYGDATTPIAIRNSTIAGNTAVISGGLYFNSFNSGIALSSTIIANNVGTPDDILGAGNVAGDNNLVFDSSGFSFTGSGNITGVNPMLDVLASNGGLTQTMALKAGSPAIDAGNNVASLSFDQRGIGFARLQGAKTDIGAYETASPIPVASLAAVGPIVTAGPTPDTVQVTYSDNIAIDVSSIGIGDIEIVAPNAATLSITGVTVDINTNGSPRVATYTFNVPGGGWDAADNGVYQVNILANQVADADAVPQFVPAGSLGKFSVAIATTYSVDVTTDVDNGNYGTGNLSFREALKLANDSPATNDTITFNPTVFATAQAIVLTGGQYNILDAVTINGPGAGKLTFDANNASRHFNIDVPGSSTNDVIISDITLTKGTVSNVNGGSILNSDENLTLSNVVLSKNTSTASGGAIAMTKTEAGLTIADSTLTQNASAGSAGNDLGGGALFVFGNSTVAIVRSTITGNISTNHAGGIYMFNGGILVVLESTLSGNSADRMGGAITSQSAGVGVINSTVTGNKASQGGGIRMNLNGNFIVNNSTIAGNTASFNGGGISIATTLITATISSSIVATNINANAPDIATPFGFIIGGGNNVIGISDQGNFTLSGTNKTGTGANPLDPLLGPLVNNGGLTLTMGLLAGSPAIDAGADNGYPFDQRGSGFPRKAGASADVGAFEGTINYPIAKFSTFGPVIAAGPTPNSLTITYSDNIGINVASIGVADVTILDPLANQLVITGASASPNTNGTPRTVTYTFTPPGGTWNVADNGAYTVQINANEIVDIDSTPLSVPAGIVGTFQVAVPITYRVDEATDIDDGNVATGFLSLREAVKLANTTNLGVADIIVFDTNVFKAGTKVTLGGTALGISDPLTIQGPGIGNLTLDGNATSRVFDINMTTAGTSVSISGMTITNGRVIDGAGGGIMNLNASLILTQVSVTANNAVASLDDGNGGGIAIVSPLASLTLVDCTLSNNVASGISAQGGGIHIQSDSVITILRSTISGNQAGEDGGAIYFYSGGTLSVTDSTISGNKANISAAGGGGGAAYLFGTVATIRNSTISGNSTNTGGFASNGGGIAALSNTTLSIQNSTVAFNTAGTVSGGGLFLGTGTIISSESTLVAKNTAILGPDIAGQLVAKFSLIGDDIGTTLLTGSANNIVNVDPLLSVLANNGGPTFTHALQPGSPALNTGNNPNNVSFDQRGSGFARLAGAAVDIGSFELQPPAKVSGLIINGGAVQRSRVTTVAISFDQHVTLSNAFQLLRQGDSKTVTLATALDDSGPGTVVTLTFTGGAVDGASLADGRYSLTVLASKVSNSNGSLDGNGNGVAQGSPADDYVFASADIPNLPTNIFRIFGDSDGDGTIAAVDFIQFRLSLGGTNPIFDFNENNSVDASDFVQFRLRFGGAI